MLARLLLAAVVAAVGSPQPTAVNVERVAGNRVDFTVTFQYGPPDRFVGYSENGRPTWLTTCFLREFYGKLCGPAPAGAAQESAPGWVLPARFAHPLDPGLIRPEALAVANDGSLLILDAIRDELFARSPDGSLRPLMSTTATALAVAPDGSVYLAVGKRVAVRAPNGSVRTLPQRLGEVSSLAFANDGTLYLGLTNSIVGVARNGSTHTVFRSGGPSGYEIVVRGRRYGGFSTDHMTVGGNGDLFVFSFSGKTIYEITPSGKPLRAWQTYAHGLATAPDGSVVIGTQFGAVQRIRAGRLSTVVDLGSGKQLGFPFQEDGVAVARDGTIFVDTLVGNGYTNQTAVAAVSPDGQARLLRTTTPLAATLPPGMTTGCPSSRGLRSFDASARKAAFRAAEVVDMAPFDRGLSLTDPSWWSGFYTDQIDGRYGGGRHHVYSVGPASADPYESAVAHRCGAALVHHSIAVVVGHGVYSDQVSHMFFLDRDGRAFLYWQHT
jgi:hypothetical protein